MGTSLHLSKLKIGIFTTLNHSYINTTQHIATAFS